jgi:hypothetical protein
MYSSGRDAFQRLSPAVDSQCSGHVMQQVSAAQLQGTVCMAAVPLLLLLLL